jgi:hypothetical protein
MEKKRLKVFIVLFTITNENKQLLMFSKDTTNRSKMSLISMRINTLIES